ncbi:MAG: hypothetical protein J3Q66DRAFT_441650 [Benniella sp.]|nr:MAG: hypothetical protein J3Q66DRAFT_441650 [Benniella sp.]
MALLRLQLQLQLRLQLDTCTLHPALSTALFRRQKDKNLTLEGMIRFIVVYFEKMGVSNTMFKHASINTLSQAWRRSSHGTLVLKSGRTWLLKNARPQITRQDPMSLSLRGDLDWCTLQRSKMPWSTFHVVLHQ